MARTRSMPAFRSIAEEIERRVLAGELPVGSALPGEQVLATVFDVSRSTIRGSIRLLEQMGLIARRQGRNKLLITAPQSEDSWHRPVANAPHMPAQTTILTRSARTVCYTVCPGNQCAEKRV